MKTTMNPNRSWLNAITFAEAGEWETAREMMPPPAPRNKLLALLEKTFMAVAFAEESLHDEAKYLVGKTNKATNRAGSFLDSVGLRGVRVTYGVLQEGAIR